MAYRFKLGVSLTKEFRRIAADELDRVTVAFAAAASDPAARTAGIHSGRKSIKRLRALLRLVRPGLNEAQWRNENIRLRDLARAVSADRDRDVLLEAMTGLAAGNPVLTGKIEHQVKDLIAAVASSGKDNATTIDMAAAQARLDASRKAIARMKIEPAEIETLSFGVARSLRQTRASLAEAIDAASDDAFHELRKGVQIHWRHMQLLRRAWPDTMMAREAAARRLSQVLGDDHDLAVLRAFVSRDTTDLAADARDLTLAAIAARQVELRARAVPAATQLTADSPDGLSRRIGVYWRAAQSLAALSPADEPTTEAAAPVTPKSPRSRRKPVALKRASKPTAP